MVDPVGDSAVKLLSGDLDPNIQVIIGCAFIDPVFEDVLDEGDEEHGRDADGRDIAADIDTGFDGVADAHFFQLDVITDKFEFRRERDILFGALLEEVAHDGAEFFDEVGGEGGFALCDEVDIVQGIEEEVGLYLGFEQVQLGFGVLFQERLLLLFDGEVVEGEAVGDTEDIKECIDDEAVIIGLEFYFEGFMDDEAKPDIHFGLDTRHRDDDEHDQDAGEVEKIFFPAVELWHEPECVRIEDGGIGDG